MTKRNPDMANIFIPKTFSLVETMTSRDIKALMGVRPYIPLVSKRKEFKEVARVQTELLDGYLNQAGFLSKTTNCKKISNLYGTAFMEQVPVYERVIQKALVPETIFGVTVGTKIIEQRVPRLRLKAKVWAPWEVYVDPFALNLEEKGGCRFIIKFQLVSKRQLKIMAGRGAYPGLDVELLDKVNFETGTKQADHWGQRMLTDIGLTIPEGEDDFGILMRYESEERYIDSWNGMVVLRDIPNPYKHGMINLSRMIHIQDAHTQNSFWGIGEAQSNAVLQSMLNDTWAQTFNNHNMMNQPMIYYRQGTVNPDALVRTSGNRVAIDDDMGRPLSDNIHESFGQTLPRDHYAIPATIERMIDLNSGQFNVQRGEADSNEKTLGEAAMLKESGDARQEMSIKLDEDIYLTDIGRKAFSHVDQFATTDDLVEMVGVEDASLLFAVNPQDLPGGYNFEYRGSDKVVNQLIKQRNLKELMPLLLNVPNVLPGWLATKLLEVHGFKDRDIREGVVPDEIMMQLQGLAAQEAELQAQLLPSNAGGAPTQGQKFAKNSPSQEATKSGSAGVAKQ